MKKRCFAAVFVVLVVLVATALSAQNTADFTYTANNGEVTITGYTGMVKDVAIPGRIDNLPVTAIGEGAFQEKQLTGVSIPDSVTAIGEWAFAENQLTSVTIPGSVTVIGEGAFEENQLTSVTIPDSVTVIGDAAFRENQLTGVTIPANVTITASSSWYASFPGNFAEAYTRGGKRAGTYTSSDGGGTWSREAAAQDMAMFQSSDSLWFTDIKKMGINNGDGFIITLNEDRTSGPIVLDFENRGVTIIFRSANDLKNLSLAGTGALFTIDKGVTLVLENIALTGVTGNNSALITIKNGGTLVMNSGVIISGNINNHGDGQGGGVYIEEGNFFMNGGEISNNFAKFGGGVRQKIDGEFTMSGGTIKNNTGENAGGGLYLNGNDFKFTGGSIEGNSAQLGGGVLIHGGKFDMRGSSIGGNSAYTDGGGLFVARGTFEKTGGIIYGADEDDVSLRNTAGNKGHAVFTSNLIRDTTAGIDINLKSYTYSIF